MREAADAATPPQQSSALLPEQRRSRILEILGSQELARPAELAADLQVSLETVRRDLLALEEEGRLRRVYGAASLTGDRRRPSEPGDEVRMGWSEPRPFLDPQRLVPVLPRPVESP